jgi:hypothetical protein
MLKIWGRLAQEDDAPGTEVVGDVGEIEER